MCVGSGGTDKALAGTEFHGTGHNRADGGKLPVKNNILVVHMHIGLNMRHLKIF